MNPRAPDSLRTARLRLRRLAAGDAAGLSATASDPRVMEHWYSGPNPDIAAVERRIAHMDTHWQRHGFGDWGIVESEAERLIGFAGLHHIDGMREVNLGYALQRSVWRRGYGREACLAILDIGFTVLRLPEIVAVISPQNTPSQRLAEELGFSVWKETRWSGQPRLVYRARP